MNTDDNSADFKKEVFEASSRKKEHIDLALKSQLPLLSKDNRFYYEPGIHAHPKDENSTPLDRIAKTFIGYDFGAPWWISSMTGGTKDANAINKNIARIVKKHKLGMGLGSCRSLLTSDEYLDDFRLRSIVGDDRPIFANLGVAQIEYLRQDQKLNRIKEVVDKTEANGLIIHINPLQEWLQPEGDRYFIDPIDTIRYVLDIVDFPIIVKEVGQGMGPKSLLSLMKLPLQAIEFAAFGGTNFAKLELMRNDSVFNDALQPLTTIGHSASEMVDFVNQIQLDHTDILMKSFIISGGISNFLDGFYLIQKLNGNAVMGQASSILKYAKEGYELLEEYMSYQIQGYRFAQQFLSLRSA